MSKCCTPGPQNNDWPVSQLPQKLWTLPRAFRFRQPFLRALSLQPDMFEKEQLGKTLDDFVGEEEEEKHEQ